MDIEQIVREAVEQVLKKKETNTGSYTPSQPLSYPEEKTVLVDNPLDYGTIAKAQMKTPARIGIGRAGTRMKTRSYLDFRLDHAAAQDAVRKEVSEAFLENLGAPVLKTRAKSLDHYLMDLDAGRILNDESIQWLRENGDKGKQVQIIISDGLSITGIEENIPNLLPSLEQGLRMKGITIGKPLFVKRSRVWVQDQIASLLDCMLVISLIGERPGLATSKSVSAYMIYRPGEDSVEADRTVISNIHDGGIPPVEAGAYLADLIEDMLKKKASGVKYASFIENA